MRKIVRLTAFFACAVAGLMAQTTQGLISGSVIDSVTGRPVAGATIAYSNPALAVAGTSTGDAGGAYFLPMLSPGGYNIRASADGYQAQELQQLELTVAGRIQIDFKLRPLHDVWEAGQYRSVFLPGSKTIVTFYGPDVDTSRSGSFEGQQGTRGTLDTSVSYVIDPEQIGDLPLLGRDVYTMLVSLPGVTADNGTGRGLGISVSGARPSSSNYLLDGVENNNYLVTGPLNPVAPEAVQEYRISTNNYSAEYGQTAGFVANAVTRAGTPEYHGLGYEYLKNDALNAADFADNLNGTGRARQHENQFGYQIGGPLPKTGKKLVFSSALEELISHSQQAAQTYVLPTTNFLAALNVQPTRDSYKLLKQYPGPVIQSNNLTAPYTVSPPVVVDRLIALERGDYTLRGGKDHLMGRVNIARVSQPDFIWTPYPDFTTPLHENTFGIAGNWTHTWTPRLSSELKVAYSDDNLWWDRAHPEVPALGSYDGVDLPGSTSAYSYRNHNRTPEAIYSTVWTRNRHIISAGLGVLGRYNSGYLTAGRDGIYFFSNAISFAFDQPEFFEAAVSRTSTTPSLPNYNRDYSYTQSYFFAQDSYRVNSRLTLNYGIRYERYGAPQNTGAAKDTLLVLGAGANFNARLASATLQTPTSGDQQIYGADNGDWAPRFGFSLDPLGKGKTIVRGGFGMFYDRPFDNLWQNVRNNGYVVPLYSVTSAPTDFLAPVSSVLPSYANQSGSVVNANFPGLTLMDPKLKNGYAQTFFLGAEQRVGDNLLLQVNGTGSLGRRLITTDIVNREYTTTIGLGRPDNALPDVSWRSGQGLSDYYALNALVRYRLRNALFQAAYTWSHSIDNQSDPLVGDFFSLDFTSINNSAGTGLKSSFAQQYNSNGDRGNSEFDQRQNLFLTGTWQSPYRHIAARGWQIAWLAAFRSGLPYTVLSTVSNAVFGAGEVQNQRADLLNPATAVYSTPLKTTGGVVLLNSAAFGQPTAAGVVGTSGRDAFIGPGLYSINLSIGRTFSVPYLREGTRMTIRADAFNILNHANLNNPDNLLGDANFGVATYGRQGTPSGFPAVSPVNETARQIQLLLRIEF
jgi:hypothetical protein